MVTELGSDALWTGERDVQAVRSAFMSIVEVLSGYRTDTTLGIYVQTA